MITIDMLALLKEAQEAHHEAEKELPQHDWAVWYAAYIEQRIQGMSPGVSHIFANAAIRRG